PLSPIEKHLIYYFCMSYAITDATDRFSTPIYYRGKNGYSVLLLHGFTSTPVVFDEIAQALHKMGFTVYAPLIAGHGTTPEDLEGTTWKDWFLSGEEGYERLRSESDHFFVLGASFGCNLAAVLASEHPVAGLIMIGFPRWLQHHTIVKAITAYHQVRNIRFFE